MRKPFDFTSSGIPLFISIPHNGFAIPGELAPSMTDVGRSSIDTDWFLDRLYEFADELDVGRIVARYSRYAVDLNRPLSNESLYPGQTTTGLFPTESFAGEPLFEGPRDAMINDALVRHIWRPYHTALRNELNRLRDKFGRVVLFDAHSIASCVPRLFEGQLPDLNFGTNHGATCDPSLADALRETVEHENDRSHVFNGRFVGGHITRQYGDPANRIHAVQLELSQATYLNEDTREWSDDKAGDVQRALRSIIETIAEWVTQ